MSRPIDGAQGGEPHESRRGLEPVERVLEPQHLMPLDRLVAVSLSNGCLCRRQTIARFDRLTTPRTVPSHVEGQLRYGSIKECVTYHVLGVITKAGMT